MINPATVVSRSYRESDFQGQGHVGVAMPYRAEDEQKNCQQGHQTQKADYSETHCS